MFETPKGCGILPASFGMAAVQTEGFKWELTKDKPLVFGKFLSTSNEFVSEQVTIDTDDDIYLITTIK